MCVRSAVLRVEGEGRVGVEAELYLFVVSAVGGCEWSTSLPGHFTSGERASGTLVLTE